MALKTYKPTSPGRRQLVLVDRSELHKGRPVKMLTEGLTKTGGRNNKGRMTARHKGGGAKRLYRKIDFKRNRWDVPATVERLEYDPNRTAFIALIIGGAELDANFAKAAQNIPNVDVLPAAGLNVYDVLRRKTLVLTKDALESIDARFNGAKAEA